MSRDPIGDFVLSIIPPSALVYLLGYFIYVLSEFSAWDFGHFIFFLFQILAFARMLALLEDIFDTFFQRDP